MQVEEAVCSLLSVRWRIQQIQLVKGPNRILLTLEDLTFIDPQLSKQAGFPHWSIKQHYAEISLFVNLQTTGCQVNTNSQFAEYGHSPPHKKCNIEQMYRACIRKVNIASK